MPIYCYFWYKSEYQFDNYLIKHVAFSALSKNVPPPPPFQWPSAGAVSGGFVKKRHNFY